MPSFNGHSEDCLCVPCMMADMDAHVAANGGTVYGNEKTAPETTRYLRPGQGAGKGKRGTRKISERQVKFLLKLISEKDATNVKLFPGQTLNPTEIGNMGLPAGKALIDKMIAAPYKATRKSVKVTDQGSDKQKAFLQSLMEQTNTSEADINSSYSNISAAITALLSKRNTMPKAPSKPRKALSPGMYIKDGQMYKLDYTRSSGQLVAYAWKLYSTPVPTAKGLKFGEFEYQGKSPLYKLSDDDRMSLDEAKAHGIEFHYCCRCGIELTNPESIANGIGPVCITKF